MIKGTYIILSYCFAGVSGGSAYVSNKMTFLENRGYKVAVFDGGGGRCSEVLFQNLKQFKNNRYLELYFRPTLFCKKHQEHLLDRLIEDINGVEGNVIVESNCMDISFWGEMLAQRLHGRHIIFDLSENSIINEDAIFDFYKFKYDRNEVFSITKEASRLLFNKYYDIPDPEKRFLSANCWVYPQDVPCDRLDDITEDYKILVFSRYKLFFPNMIKGFCEFAKAHCDKTIALLFLGVNGLDNALARQLEEFPNLHPIYFGNKLPPPKSLFQIADIITATAGCASMSYWIGYNVISWDATKGQPLGVVGYTTTSTLMAKETDNHEESFAQILEDCLVNKKYNDPRVLDIPKSNRGSDFQLALAVEHCNKQYWTRMDEIIPYRKACRKIDILVALRLYRISAWARYGKIKRIKMV